jgi:quercetin dioxygenase-like cupin family protein
MLQFCDTVGRLCRGNEKTAIVSLAVLFTAVFLVSAAPGWVINTAARNQTLPHFHPQTEYSIVLLGTLLYGVGDKWDDAAMREISPGGFLVKKEGTHHDSKARGETITQVSKMSPAE